MPPEGPEDDSAEQPSSHQQAWQAAVHREVIAVDPARLSFGRWSEQASKTIGEGDVHAAYSADVIGLKGRVRKPFRLAGARFVATSLHFMRGSGAEAYRLTPLESFEGTATTYHEKLSTNGGDDARRDPLGFYHGMRVEYGGKPYVLTGPPVRIVAGEPAPIQPRLF